jgi:hypothetical protein
MRSSGSNGPLWNQRSSRAYGSGAGRFRQSRLRGLLPKVIVGLARSVLWPVPGQHRGLTPGETIGDTSWSQLAELLRFSAEAIPNPTGLTRGRGPGAIAPGRVRWVAPQTASSAPLTLPSPPGRRGERDRKPALRVTRFAVPPRDTCTGAGPRPADTCRS